MLKLFAPPANGAPPNVLHKRSRTVPNVLTVDKTQISRPAPAVTRSDVSTQGLSELADAPSRTSSWPLPLYNTDGDWQSGPFELDTSYKNPAVSAKSEDFSTKIDLECDILKESRSSSPLRSEKKAWSVFGGTQTEEDQVSQKPGRLSRWFEGESQPVRIGLVPQSPSKTSNSGDEESDTLPNTLHNRKSSLASFRPAMASRFSFGRSKTSLVKPDLSRTAVDDEMLDPNLALSLMEYMHADGPAANSTKELYKQAETLVKRLQAAYKERVRERDDMAGEKEAATEESQSHEIRNRHLKIQLDDLSTKLAEQDRAMMDLVDQLAHERQARAEEQEARKRTLKMVRPETPASPSVSRQSNRESNAFSDVALDSDNESAADSVFSKPPPNSPTMSMTSVSTLSSPDAVQYAEVQRFTPVTQPARLRIPGAAYTSNSVSKHASTPHSEPKTSNQALLPAAELKSENANLKSRIVDLEGALDSALTMMNSIGL